MERHLYSYSQNKKTCDALNSEMLSRNAFKVHEIYCTDKIDESTGNRKMTKKAIEHLDKLNTHCNITAGLEAELSPAVGAHVMLRRNIDTKAGLVNGAIGNVLSIGAQHVRVQFDKLPCSKIEKVKSRFMVIKNFYVHRQQFPLILAYAVTIHKCQGLSLDCAIVDLSSELFSDGMAYVALSTGRSLDGLFLKAFDPQSISVSSSSLAEVNHLRKKYRSDLPLYQIPSAPRRKRELTGLEKSVAPSSKKDKPTPMKMAPSVNKPDHNPNYNKDCVITHTKPHAVTPLRFHSVNNQSSSAKAKMLL